MASLSTRRFIVAVMVAALALAAAGTGALAANNVLKVSAYSNTYALLYKELILPDGDNLTFETKMLIDPVNSGATWAPGIRLMWDSGNQAVIQHQRGKGTLRIGDAVNSSTRLAPGVWLTAKIELTPTVIRYSAQREGEDWVVIEETSRDPLYSGAPLALGIGKAAKSGKSWERSYSDVGETGVNYFEYVVVKAGDKVILDEQFEDPDFLNWEPLVDIVNPEPALSIVPIAEAAVAQ